MFYKIYFSYKYYIITIYYKKSYINGRFSPMYLFLKARLMKKFLGKKKTAFYAVFFFSFNLVSLNFITFALLFLLMKSAVIVICFIFSSK